MKHYTLQSHYLKVIFVFIQFKEALKPSKTYRPRHELDPDHDHTDRERQNVEAVVPEIVQESTEMQEYYLNPIHVTETNGMRREDDQGHLQTGIRNPNFQIMIYKRTSHLHALYLHRDHQNTEMKMQKLMKMKMCSSTKT